MAFFTKVPPLDWQTPIVDTENGYPSAQFIRLWQQMFQNGDFTSAQLATKADKTTQIIAGVGLDGGGDLSQDRTISLDAVLNDLNDVDTVTTPPTDGQALVFDEGAGLWVPDTISGGSGTLIGITQLVLPADFNVATGAWRLPTTWSEERDTLSAYTAGDTFVTVPTGVTLVKASAMVGWSNGDSQRAVAVSDSSTFAATGNHILHDARPGVFETLSAIEGPFIPVTAGTPFYIGFNSFFAAANLSGASGTNFGRPTRIAFEWYSDWPI